MDEQVFSPVSSVDRISALPDEIISIILSKLPVEESARTSILSKRWPKIWLLSPITVSDESILLQSATFSGDDIDSSVNWIINAMSHIISTHPGPVHSCYFGLDVWDGHYETLVRLLRTVTQKGILNLQIDFDYLFLEIPFFVLECKSLVDVVLCRVTINDQLPAGSDIFPNVRKLTVAYCGFSDNFLVILLRLNSIIELQLHVCYDLEDVVIESDSLQGFSFQGSDVNVNLIVKDAPNLKSLEFIGLTSWSRVVILSAPNLKVMSYINLAILMLQLGNYQFKPHNKYLEISGEMTYMPSVQSLKIEVNFSRGYEPKTLPQFLMCFPCLETLDVWMLTYDCFPSSSDDDDDYDNDTAAVVDRKYDSYALLTSNINCLNNHLKNVLVVNYKGSQVHLDYVKLIIVNARVLETVNLVYDNAFKEKWIEAKKNVL